ncbi:MAG: mucoidy inhibitor MuiA family protein [Bacteroidota bacterium]|nr:mucoidy inhibitor MuiA family protein [Bacteroidota bacterium]
MRTILTALTLIFYFAAQSQSKKLNAETSIQNVTIFSSGARVERTAVVNVGSGRSEISFAGLSNQLDPQTVQLKADADITLLSVQTTRDFLTERRIEQQEKEFIDRTNTLKDKSDLDQKLLEVSKNEEAMLIKNQAIGGQAGVKTIDLKDALEFQRQRLTDLYEKELEIKKRLASEQQDLERNKAQMQENSKKRDSINYIVTVLVDSKESRTVNFQLMYNVQDAGWYPTYDVRVTEITEPLNVLMNANVFQRSGETWKNIPLQLSTGNPKDNATPSSLQPWMLGFYDPSVSLRAPGPQGEISGRVTNEKGEPVPGATVSVKGIGNSVATDGNGYFRLRNMPKDGTLLISDAGYNAREIRAATGYITIALTASSNDANEVAVTAYGLQGEVAGVRVSNYAQDKKKESIQTVSTATQYQPTAMIYRIDDKYTLESDGKTTSIGIKQFEVPASYDYYAAPKIDPTAFLTAKVINWQDFDLQSGEASLYFEGSYLGKTYIDLSSTGDTLSLSLGKDNGIRISRKLLKEYSTKKFIGSNRTDSRQYEISVRNSKRVPVNISLLDQIPVSTTREISVEDVKAAEARIDKESGIATWTIALAPGEEKKLGINYNVKYAKDQRVVLE